MRSLGEARREIVSGARNQPHARTVPARENAKAIVLDFVNPARARRRRLSRRGQIRFDYPQAGPGTLTQRHARLLERATQRVESADIS
jgi:hypothetical protein